MAEATDGTAVHHRELVWQTTERPGIEVWRDDVQRGGLRWDQHRIVVAGGAPGCVVVAVRGGRLLLVRSWRPVVDAWLWELPRGFNTAADNPIVPAEQPERTAERELLEETGHRSAATTLAGYVYPDSGLLASRVAVVRIEVRPGEPTAGDGEVTNVGWWELTRVPELIADGTLADGLSLAALALTGLANG